MSQTFCYAVPAELDGAFRARLRETGIEAEFGPVRTAEPRDAAAVLHSLSKSDGELFLTPELALVCLLASSQEEVDDFAESFSEDDCRRDESSGFAGGDPMALDDESFIRFVRRKGVTADEADLWDKAVEDALILVRETDGVRDAAVVEARWSLMASLKRLEALLGRVRTLCTPA